MSFLFSSRSRPLLITIAAIVLALMGILNICAGVGSATINVGTLGLAGGTVIGGIGALLVGILRVIMAGGLWSGAGWARWLVIIGSVLSIAGVIFGAGDAANSVYGNRVGAGDIIGIIIQVAILVYMFSAGVKRYFNAA